MVAPGRTFPSNLGFYVDSYGQRRARSWPSSRSLVDGPAGRFFVGAKWLVAALAVPADARC